VIAIELLRRHDETKESRKREVPARTVRHA